MKWRSVLMWGRGFPFAILAVVAEAVILLPLRGAIQPAAFMLLAVPVVVLVARVSGVRQSAVSAVAAFLAIDLLFVPPYGRLTVASPAEWIALLVFLLVALVIGQQTALLGRRERAARRRQEELELINRLSFRVASEKSAEATAQFIAEQVVAVVGCDHAALYVLAPNGGPPTCLAAAGDSSAHEEEAAFVAWVALNDKAVGFSSVAGVPPDQRPASVSAQEAIPGVSTRAVYLPLQTSTSLEGVLCARFPAPAGESEAGSDTARDDEVRLLVAVANLAAASLERSRLESEAARAEALQEADRLKTTLVSSVSHELKTPLAAATARVTGLIEEGEGCGAERMHDEMIAVSHDLDRLNDSIGDLLDLSRLESDSWRPTLEEVDVGDVLGTVFARVPSAERGRVHFHIAEDLPAVRADFGQLVSALLNLVENALVYSPAGTDVEVAAESVRNDVVVSVTDQGPGVHDAEKESVFEKFVRGSASHVAPSGTGLGLAITREIVRTNGGRIWIEDVEPEGARFLLALPACSRAAETERT